MPALPETARTEGPPACETHGGAAARPGPRAVPQSVRRAKAASLLNVVSSVGPKPCCSAGVCRNGGSNVADPGPRALSGGPGPPSPQPPEPLPRVPWGWAQPIEGPSLLPPGSVLCGPRSSGTRGRCPEECVTPDDRRRGWGP